MKLSVIDLNGVSLEGDFQLGSGRSPPATGGQHRAAWKLHILRHSDEEKSSENIPQSSLSSQHLRYCEI